jgi:hypothetical protein
MTAEAQRLRIDLRGLHRRSSACFSSAPWHVSQAIALCFEGAASLTVSSWHSVQRARPAYTIGLAAASVTALAR